MQNGNSNGNNTDWVQELPNWKEACPLCGGQRSGRRDGTAVWCRQCGHNWKVSKYPPKGNQPRKNDPNKDPIKILADEMVEMNKKLDRILKILTPNIIGQDPNDISEYPFK